MQRGGERGRSALKPRTFSRCRFAWVDMFVRPLRLIRCALRSKRGVVSSVVTLCFVLGSPGGPDITVSSEVGMPPAKESRDLIHVIMGLERRERGRRERAVEGGEGRGWRDGGEEEKRRSEREV